MLVGATVTANANFDLASLSSSPEGRVDCSQSPAETARHGREYSGTGSVSRHVRRIAVLFLTVLCRTWIPFLALGAFNRVFPTFASVFFCYAGNENYARHYSYARCRAFQLWFPSTIGTFRQGRKWGLICASTVTEGEFSNPDNAKDFESLLKRLVRIKAMLGVGQLSFAGILPSVLRRKYPEIPLGPDPTPEVVRLAVHKVREEHFGARRHKVVLLGGAGRIGSVLQKSLAADGCDVTVVDTGRIGGNSSAFHGNVVLVDVSRYGVLQEYVDRLPKGSVIVNEVFPEPGPNVTSRLKAHCLHAYHICGVEAEVFPSLPLAYKDALPCCAIHSVELGKPVLTRIA